MKIPEGAKTLYSMNGNVRGWTMRNPDYPEKSDQKYLREGADILVYMIPDKIKKDDCVVLVEGYKDADKFYSLGYQAMALNTSTLSLEGWRKIFYAGYNNFLLAFDDDKAGVQGMLNCIQTVYSNQIPIVLNCVDLNLYDGKDPKDCSDGAIHNIMNDKVNALKWAAYVNLGKFRKDYLNKQDTQNAIHWIAALSVEVGENWEHILRNYLEVLSFNLDITLGDMAATIKIIQKQKIGIHNHKLGEYIIRRSPEVFEKLGTIGLVEYVNRMSKKILSFTDLDDFLSCVNSYAQDNLPFVHTSTGFYNIDQAIGNVLSGLMIIGGAPGIGKTAFLTQVIKSQLEANPETGAMFMSFDMEKKELTERIMACELNSTIFDLRNTNIKKDLQARIKDNHWMTRLSIADKHFIFTPEHIRFAVNNYMAEKKLKNMIIVIDYLQLIPLGQGVNDLQRDEIIAGALLHLKEALHPFPIICISELNKTTDFKGSSMSSFKGSVRLVYSTDIAIVITKLEKAAEEFNITSTKLADNSLTGLTVNVVKSRQGKVGNSKLIFKYDTYQFVEHNSFTNIEDKLGITL